MDRYCRGYCADHFRFARARAILVAGAVSTLLAYFLVKHDRTEAHRQPEVVKEYSVAAADFVEEHAYPGPLYDHYNWGGYLIRHLPRYPVAMNGRTIMHGEERIQRAEATWQGQPRWDRDPEHTGAGLVIAQTRSPLVSIPRRETRFRQVYGDDVTTVCVQEFPGERTIRRAPPAT